MINLRRIPHSYKQKLSCTILAVPVFICLLLFLKVIINSKSAKSDHSDNIVVYGNDGTAHNYNRSSPLVFITSFPRSGVTLLQKMLNAHSDIRCNPETTLVRSILKLSKEWRHQKLEVNRLYQAGITAQILGDAMAAFMLEVMAKQGEPAALLCNRDSYTLKHGDYLLSLFPNAKFILVIRDGRAVTHSMITNNVSGYEIKDYGQVLMAWSQEMETMWEQCNELGLSKCLKVRYEELVLHTKLEMERILNFLDVPWQDNIMKSVDVKALSKWVEAIPLDIRDEIDSIAPTLRTFGYDPDAYPPNYEKLDSEITTESGGQSEKWTKLVRSVLQKSSDRV